MKRKCIESKLWRAAALCLLVVCLTSGFGQLLGQRDSDDDFDDAGFDDSGYSQPQNHDAEGSNQNPSNYSPSSEEDLDDDDDVDETHVRPRVAQEETGGSRPSGYNRQPQQVASYRQEPLYHQPGYFQPNLQAPQRFYSSPNSVMLANVMPNQQQVRYKREAPLSRKRRHSKYIGPVYTYVKTDKHAHYKWGVKHKVGKSKHYG